MKNPFSKARIYADWAATTPMHPKVTKAMKATQALWANPSAIHKEGVEAKKFLDTVRARCAKVLSVKPDELYFTSGGTEANVTIINGVIKNRLDKGIKPDDVHVVSSSIEHSSVIETLSLFEKQGVKVTYINPGSDGIVRAEDVLNAITSNTALVTCMYANNEIGTIQPISKIGAGIRKILAEKGEAPVFHVDASQAPLWLSCDMEGLRADAMTLDAHKMQGPKGVGLLVVRRGTNFESLMTGGGQERGKRPTTESVELIAGLVTALEIAHKGREDRFRKAGEAQEYFIDLIKKELPAAVINGSTEKRLPNNINISLPNLSDPEMAVLKLDVAGVACSTKSSCLKGEEDSYVVRSIIDGEVNTDSSKKWRSRNTLRFSFDPQISKSEIRKILEALRRI